MKYVSLYFLCVFICFGGIISCTSKDDNKSKTDTQQLTSDLKAETLRAWKAYEKYAWGHDELKPLTKSYGDWYQEPLYISLIDAYSTIKMMGFEPEANRIERFIADSLIFDKDIYVKTFEVNIRILGGLLSIYDMTGDSVILKKAIEFADRIVPAFQSKSGMPYYNVNLKTGKTQGDTICAAEAGSYLIEMGVLSYYTQNPKYYQLAKQSTMRVFENRSALGLINQDFSVSTGNNTNSVSRIGCMVDSYFEYIYKAWLLFGDKDLKDMWDKTLEPINKYNAVETDASLWYAIVNSGDGSVISTEVTLYDAYFPALQIYSGDSLHAIKSMNSWNKIWNRYGLLPVVYDFKSQQVRNAGYYLNPELIESNYYLWYFTHNQAYLQQLEKCYSDIKKWCRNDIAFSNMVDVTTKKQDDGLSTYFFAETLKYFYLAFSQSEEYNLTNYVFSTEAHPFRKSHFKRYEIAKRLGVAGEQVSN